VSLGDEGLLDFPDSLLLPLKLKPKRRDFMKRKISLVLTLGLLMGFCVLSMDAQAEEKKAELHLIYDILVKPSKVFEFEKALKEEFIIYAKHGIRIPNQMASTDDFHYYLLLPMENFAGIDELYKQFDEAHKKMGAETYGAILKSFEGTYEYFRIQMWTLRHDLSHMPENPRTKPEEVKFVHYGFYYFKAGMQAEAEKLAKKYKALYESKNIPDGYLLWVGSIGTDSPVFCVVSTGQSAEDFFAHGTNNQKLLGEEAKALNLKVLPLIRKYETKIGMPRPDLLPPPKEQ